MCSHTESGVIIAYAVGIVYYHPFILRMYGGEHGSARV